MLSMADKMRTKSKKSGSKEDGLCPNSVSSFVSSDNTQHPRLRVCMRCATDDENGRAVGTKDATYKDLLTLLKRVRKTLGDVLSKSSTSVASNKLLEQIALKKPTSLAEMQRIEGFGSRRDQKFEWFANAVQHVIDGKVVQP